MVVELEVYLGDFDDKRWEKLKEYENHENRFGLSIEPIEEKLERAVKETIRKEYEEMLQKQEREEFKNMLENISYHLGNEDC